MILIVVKFLLYMVVMSKFWVSFLIKLMVYLIIEKLVFFRFGFFFRIVKLLLLLKLVLLLFLL